jgi:hypothetical protein
MRTNYDDCHPSNAVAWLASFRPLTTETLIESQASPCGIRSQRMALGQVSFRLL